MVSMKENRLLVKVSIIRYSQTVDVKTFIRWNKHSKENKMFSSLKNSFQILKHVILVKQTVGNVSTSDTSLCLIFKTDKSIQFFLTFSN